LVDLGLGRLKRSCKDKEAAGLLVVRPRGPGAKSEEETDLDWFDLDLFLGLLNQSRTEDMALDDDAKPMRT
jgi:hypothetical protein